MHDIFDQIVHKLGLNRFLLAPRELSGEENIQYVESYLDAFVDGQIHILKRCISLFEQQDTIVKEWNTYLYLQRKILPETPIHACGATPFSKCGDEMVSIERDGSVVECQNLREKQHLSKSTREKMIQRYGICNNCEIRGHCSTPVCFSRFTESFNRRFESQEPISHALVKVICNSNKKREKALFAFFLEHKNSILKYFFECST